MASDSNQYDSVASVPYTYDGNGNLISDGYYYYVYDYLDRLSEVYIITYQSITPRGETHTSIDDWILGSSRTARLLRAGIANVSVR